VEGKKCDQGEDIEARVDPGVFEWHLQLGRAETIPSTRKEEKAKISDLIKMRSPIGNTSKKKSLGAEREF